MASIILPQRIASQPQEGALLDLGHPLLRGVSEVVLPHHRRTLVQGFVTSTSNAATTFVTGASGRAVAFAGNLSNEALLIGSVPTLIPNGQRDCTIFVVRRSVDTTLRGGSLFGYQNTISDRVMAHAPYSDGNLYWDFGNSGTGRVAVSFAKSTNTESLIFTAGGASGRTVWRNGTKIIASGNFDTRLSTSANFGIGGNYTAVTSDADEVYLFGIVLHAWSDAEARMWSQNPWCIFKLPQRRWLPSVAAPQPSVDEPQVCICT